MPPDNSIQDSMDPAMFCPFLNEFEDMSTGWMQYFISKPNSHGDNHKSFALVAADINLATCEKPIMTFDIDYIYAFEWINVQTSDQKVFIYSLLSIITLDNE